MKLLIFLFFTISFFFCKAQNELLPIDEQGRFIYYELVETKEVQKNQLADRMYSFLKKPFNDLKLKISYGDTVFICLGKLVINKTVLVMSHPSGEVRYRFQAEIKQGKFRFWLTDFNFVPYQRDRYGNFVATTNKGIPLEASPGKWSSSQWKEYQIQTTEYALKFAKEFKDYMANKNLLIAPIKERAIVKKEW